MNVLIPNSCHQSDERLGFGRIGSGLGFFPGLGFGRPGFGRFGFGLPFLTGLAAGALLTPRPPYPVYQPYPIYAPYPVYTSYPYPYYY